MLINQKTIINENSRKFRQRKCIQHKLCNFQKVCTHSACIQSTALSFLCIQCHRKHPDNHNGLIQNYLDIDKIFSESIFEDIELLENDTLNVLLEKQQRLDDEVDKHCDVILQEIKELIESMKFRIKLKYGSNDLIKRVNKLKESLKNEYDTLFSIDETNIKNEDIKQYLEFYLNFEKIFEENQAKSEKIIQSIEKDILSIPQLFNQKLKDIKSTLESDSIKAK